MSIYAISFKLASDSTYQPRYTSLMEQIEKCARVWKETTSFAIVSTNETLQQLEHRLYFESSLLSSKDILFVVEVSGADAVIRGDDAFPSILGSMLPRLVEK